MQSFKKATCSYWLSLPANCLFLCVGLLLPSSLLLDVLLWHTDISTCMLLLLWPNTLLGAIVLWRACMNICLMVGYCVSNLGFFWNYPTDLSITVGRTTMEQERQCNVPSGYHNTDLVDIVPTAVGGWESRSSSHNMATWCLTLIVAVYPTATTSMAHYTLGLR